MEPPARAEAVLEAMAVRYACKLFDAERKVDDGTLRLILEAGRLSPSSFGLEPWLFVVAESAELKERLFTACFDQENLRTASFVVAIAVRTERHYAPDSPFVRSRAGRFPGGLPVFVQDYQGYWDYLRANGLVEHWARAQGYIALANMMTAAAAAGVDSCAIEGYREDEVRSVLGLDPQDWRVSVLVPFGYRGETEREKIRESLGSIVLLADNDRNDSRLLTSSQPIN
ncbi:MAG: hypothetical protein A2Z99_14635 [Treponema sp. GWB1_62_6]|nr:MAG: hypothetical protein A2Y36_00910 [Treponema sp. GWA1_62_8]OHE66417.1 MAG: hypothetical protein A2001_19315 [Treponema sp. GWC1_61_84]OHE66850.1 MAG: hypothetical protein A2Z99_14635 [Treponema sp. GWB1_62_6]OHE74277.1 MAG: hypothetical protein A2413_01665 [Treponema sp. RIFOXYC1_FULL_61_9]HCM27830.1 NAD(P)H-dependent oxidoreductase [Treponema sp.]